MSENQTEPWARAAQREARIAELQTELYRLQREKTREQEQGSGSIYSMPPVKRVGAIIPLPTGGVTILHDEDYAAERKLPELP